MVTGGCFVLSSVRKVCVIFFFLFFVLTLLDLSWSLGAVLYCLLSARYPPPIYPPHSPPLSTPLVPLILQMPCLKHVYVYIHMYIYIHMNVCVCVICVYEYTLACTCMHTHKHTHIHTRTHTHAHTHTYTHIHTQPHTQTTLQERKPSSDDQADNSRVLQLECVLLL